MQAIGLLFLAVIPPLAFLGYVLHADRREPEPLQLVLQMMGLGIVSTIPAGIIESLLGVLPLFSGGGLWGAAVRSFIQIAPVEEGAKMAMVFALVWKNRNFNEENDGIVYAAASAIGFALFENLFYVFSNGAATGFGRAFTSIPLHAFCGVVMGCYIGRARFAANAKAAGRLIRTGFIFAVSIHGLFDTFALSGTPAFFLIFPLVIALFAVGLSLLAKGRRLSLARWEKPEAADAPVTAGSPEIRRYENKYGKDKIGIDESGRCFLKPEKQIWKIVVGRFLFIASFILFALVALGLTQGTETPGMIVNVILAVIIALSVPVSVGIILELSYRRRLKPHFL